MDDLKGKRILITGASGYLASNLISSLKNTVGSIIRLSRKNQLVPVNGQADVVDIVGDIQNSHIFENALKDVDIVFHFAGQTSLYAAENKPLDDLKINVMPMLNLLETCRRMKTRPAIIFSGTATQVGIPTSLPVDETECDRPISIYDTHKLMAEKYLLSYSKREIVHGVSLRLANVYGPGPRSGSADRGVLNMMIHNALDMKPLNIYGTGEYIRDYIYIEDVVQAFIRAAVHAEQLSGKYFVIGSGEGTTLRNAIQLVAERAALKTGETIAVQHVDPPSPLHPIEFRNFTANSQRFMRVTDFHPTFSLSEGIDKTIASYDNS